jgi:predicted nucleic acid-binding Zn ribbon protein
MSGPARKPTPVAEALAAYLKRSGLETRMEQATAVEDWPGRVGPRIAAATTPLHVANGVLFVAVRSSAWLMELRMMEGEIRRRVNEGRGSGRIDRIRFVPADGPQGQERP